MNSMPLIISVAVEPKTEADQEKMSMASDFAGR
jgi:translation elongation factor EF-G